MKRLLSLLLALTLAFSVAMPILAVEAEGENEPITYPSLTEGDYNALYVTDGIKMGADFFKMNEHWNTNGITYTVPLGPSLNKAFSYDVDGQGAKPYDLTKAENRAITVTKAEDENLGKTLYQIAKDEWRAAYIGWMNENFLWTDATGMRFSVYGNTTNEAKEFAPITAAAGYMQFRNDYHTSGGIVFSAPPNGAAATNQLVISLDKFASSTAPSLFHNIRVSVSATEADGVRITTFHSNSALGGQYYINKTIGTATTEVSAHDTQALARDAIVKAAEALAAEIMAADPTATATAHKDSNDKYTVFKTAAGAAEETVAVFEIKSRQNPAYAILHNPAVTLSLNKTFAYTQSIGLKDGNDEYKIRTQNATLFAAEAPYGGTATNLNGTNYIGWGTPQSHIKLYAYRHYDRVLTDAELLQNHFADLCKWFRLDVTSLYETVGGERTLAAGQAEIGFLASHLAKFTFEDDRATVAAALAEAIEAWSFEGEGEGFDAFVADVEAGRIDGASVRALPSKYYAVIYTAYKLFLDANAEADNAARQAAVEAAVASILSTDYADYYNKTPVLTAEAFFTAEAPTTDAAKHFSAIAKENNLDMSLLSSVAPVIRERIYETFADIHAGVYYHTAVLQARLAETTAELVEYYFGDGLVDDVLGFMGYQIRLYGEQSFRAVFSIDKDIIDLLEEHGYTVTVGVLQRDKSDASLEVEKTADGWSAVTPTSTTLTKADQVIVYETGTDYHGDCFEEDGIFRYAYEITPSAKLTDSFFRGYVTIEREGNEDTLFYCETATSSFPKGASITDIAKTAKTKYGMISANIQALTPVKKVIQPTVFVGGENLSFFKVVTDEATKSVTDGFIAAFKAATGATLQAVDAADCVATDKGLIRFVKGDATAIALTDGNVIFTYTDNGEASVAAFAAALAAPEGGYPTFAYGEETPWPVCLFATECTLAAAE